MLPKTAPKYFSVDGSQIDLTAEQYTQFNQTRGQTAQKGLSELFDSSEYKSLKPDQQADAIADVWTYATSVGKSLFGGELEGWQKTVQKEGVRTTVIDRQIEKERQNAISGFNDSLYSGIESGDIDLSLQAIEGLKLSGREGSSIKTSITAKIKSIYKEAYEAGDMEKVGAIEDSLLGLYSSGIQYKRSDFTKWLLEKEK